MTPATRPDGSDGKWVEPVQADRLGACGCGAASDRQEGADAESADGYYLKADEGVLDPGGKLDPADRDHGAHRNKCDRKGNRGRGVRREHFEPDGVQKVHRGHLCQGCGRDERGNLGNPASEEPSRDRAQRAGDPDEHTAAIGHHAVEVTEGERGEQDRKKSDQECSRGVNTHGISDESERHREAVGGRDCGKTDRHDPYHPDGIARRPLSAASPTRSAGRGLSSVSFAAGVV